MIPELPPCRSVCRPSNAPARCNHHFWRISGSPLTPIHPSPGSHRGLCYGTLPSAHFIFLYHLDTLLTLPCDCRPCLSLPSAQSDLSCCNAGLSPCFRSGSLPTVTIYLGLLDLKAYSLFKFGGFLTPGSSRLDLFGFV